MVQSMIGYGGVDPSRASEMQPGANARLSNFKSEANLGLPKVPPVEIEESLGKQTEDFGGYTLGEDNGGFGSGSHPLGGYERAEDSGLEVSAIKQKAARNIGETSPIHLSQDSIERIQPVAGGRNGASGLTNAASQGLGEKRNSMGDNSYSY